MCLVVIGCLFTVDIKYIDRFATHWIICYQPLLRFGTGCHYIFSMLWHQTSIPMSNGNDVYMRLSLVYVITVLYEASFSLCYTVYYTNYFVVYVIHCLYKASFNLCYTLYWQKKWITFSHHISLRNVFQNLHLPNRLIQHLHNNHTQITCIVLVVYSCSYRCIYCCWRSIFSSNFVTTYSLISIFKLMAVVSLRLHLHYLFSIILLQQNCQFRFVVYIAFVILLF